LFGRNGECRSNAAGHNVPDSVQKVIGLGIATSPTVLTKKKLIKKLPKLIHHMVPQIIKRNKITWFPM